MVIFENRLRNNLPRIFEYDDYERCQEDGNVYCTGEFSLYPENNKSGAWSLIEEAINKKKFYQFNKITRSLCLPKDLVQNSYQNISSALVQNKIKHFQLRSQLDRLVCNHDIDTTIGGYDYFFLVAVTLYIGFVVYATIGSKKRFSKCFSVTENFGLLTDTSRSLKFVEGFRAIVMLLVMMAHSATGFLMSYVDNPEVFDMPGDDKNNPIFYVVQFYFVLSGWFLAVSVMDVVAKNKIITLADVLKMIFNRFIRFCIPIMVFISMAKSKWLFHFFANKFYSRSYQPFIGNCESNWIAMVLFYNNLDIKTACIGHGWYLSVDFQLFVVGLLLLYTFFKLKINPKLLIIVAFLAFMGHVQWIHQEITTNEQNWSLMSHMEKIYCKHTQVAYFSTLSNSITFIIAMYFGIIYHQKKNKFLQGHATVWLATVLATMFGPLWVDIHGNGITKSFLLASLKPVHGFGWCLLITGLSQNLMPSLRKLAECKPLLYMANFNFSIYLMHYTIIGVKVMGQESFLTITAGNLMRNLMVDIWAGLLISLVFHLLVDKPVQNLLRLYGPKIRIEGDPKKIE